MKIARILVGLFAAVAFSGLATAVPPGKTVEYAGGAAGKGVFDGEAHAAKGQKCNDCHPKVFKMKSGQDKITMDGINKGHFCGPCHNGEKAPKASDPKNCKTCHKK